MVEQYRKNLNTIHNRLKELNRENVRIIAVTKTHPPTVIEDLLKAGCIDFGENRQNEARDKFPLVNLEGLPTDVLPVYHHIGPLQSGAARQIPGLFHYVHGASSISGIEALAKAAIHHEEKSGESLQREIQLDRWPIRYLIQVSLTDEDSKAGGMTPEELFGLNGFIENSALKMVGFMTMGPESQDPVETREVFHRMREIRDEIYPVGKLSMGMSGDWEIAVQEGADMIRLGTAIVGRRGGGPWKPGD